jgi:hypothetical protein
MPENFSPNSYRTAKKNRTGLKELSRVHEAVLAFRLALQAPRARAHGIRLLRSLG